MWSHLPPKKTKQLILHFPARALFTPQIQTMSLALKGLIAEPRRFPKIPSKRVSFYSHRSMIARARLWQTQTRTYSRQTGIAQATQQERRVTEDLRTPDGRSRWLQEVPREERALALCCGFGAGCFSTFMETNQFVGSLVIGLVLGLLAERMVVTFPWSLLLLFLFYLYALSQTR